MFVEKHFFWLTRLLLFLLLVGAASACETHLYANDGNHGDTDSSSDVAPGTSTDTNTSSDVASDTNTDSSADTDSGVDTAGISHPTWLAASWGVWVQMRGGAVLDNEPEIDHVAGAQEIIDSFPTMGHVIFNLTSSGHSLHFTLRQNNYVDVAGIHPDSVPSLEMEQKILDVIGAYKAAGKKVVLFCGIGAPSGSLFTDEYIAAWQTYMDENDNGVVGSAYRTLIRGYLERLVGLVDGYWFDGISTMQGDLGMFIEMVREVDPSVSVTVNTGRSWILDANQEPIVVDADGAADTDTSDYKVIDWRLNNKYSDFTVGHPSALSDGAPPNSWAYEEFSIPSLIASPWTTYESKTGLGHALIPIRTKWNVPSADLAMADPEQAYRFVRRITDGGGGITFAITTSLGLMSDDEMVVLQEVDKRMQMTPKPDYVPYVRPEGAYLVGETPTK